MTLEKDMKLLAELAHERNLRKLSSIQEVPQLQPGQSIVIGSNQYKAMCHEGVWVLIPVTTDLVSVRVDTQLTGDSVFTAISVQVKKKGKYFQDT